MKFFHSLRWKLLIGLLSILVISFSISMYGLSTHQKKTYYNKTLADAQQGSAVIETALRYQLLTTDRLLVDKLFSEISNSGDYKSIILVNKQGEVRHSSDRSLVGKKLVKDKEAICKTCHVGSSITRETRTDLVEDKNGNKIMRTVNLIENGPLCHSCHEQKQRILGVLITEKDAGEMDTYLATVQTRLWISGLITLLVIFVGISLFSDKFIHRRVEMLIDGTKKVGEGQLDTEVIVKGKDEISSLAQSFNDMVSQVKDNIIEIERKNLELKTIYRIVEQLSGTIDFDKLKVHILNSIGEVLATDNCLILTFTPDMENMEIVKKERGKEAILTTVTELDKDGFPSTLSTGLSDEIITRFKRKNFVKPEISDEGHIVYIPLTVREMSLGILMAERGKSNSFSETDISLISALASHISVALENARLYTLATTDELTKAYTLRYFQLRMEEEISRFQRYGQKVALLMADLDRFKLVNDTYGHPAGDRVLQEFCKVVWENIRDIDALCRYGGEEFAVILPSTTITGAMVTAERIRAGLDRTLIEINDSDVINVTTSIGVATCPDDAQTPKDLVLCADKALYHAKGLGRNRVSNYSDIILPDKNTT